MPDKLLRCLVGLSAPVRPASEIWDFLRGCNSVRAFACDVSALTTALAAEFTPAELLAAGAFVRGSDGELKMSPVLAAPHRPFLVVRRQRAGAPVDLVNQTGSLTRSAPPAFDCLADWHTAQALTTTRIVLAPATDPALVVLSHLRLPVTPAGSLASMTAEQARQLFDPTLSVETRADVVQQGCKIALVACELNQLSRNVPAELLPVVERVEDVETALELCTADDLGVWRPTQSALDKITAAAQLGDAGLVRFHVWDSVRLSTCSVGEFRGQLFREIPPDLPMARRRLEDAIERCRTTGIVWQRLAEDILVYERALKFTLHDPLIEQLSREVNPDRRVLMFDLALYCEQVVALDSLLLQARAMLQQQSLNASTSPQEERLVPLKKITDGVLAIHRELTRRS